MIFTLLISFAGLFLNIVFSPLPLITQLPFGMDSAIVFFVGIVKGFCYVMPPFAPVLQALILYFTFRFALLSLQFVTYIINIIRGAGAHLPSLR